MQFEHICYTCNNQIIDRCKIYRVNDLCFCSTNCLKPYRESLIKRQRDNESKQNFFRRPDYGGSY